MKTITEVARVIRSKNCSPFELTLDIMFREDQDYEKVKRCNLITRELVAGLYGVELERVGRVIHFDPARAVKIGLRRVLPSGSPGDTDVYGAQQHAPLLRIRLDL